MPSRIPDDPIWTTQLPGPSPGPIVSGLDIRPDSSIATSYLVYIQDPQSRILGIYHNALAETSTRVGAPFQVGIGTAISGTRIAC